MCKGLILLVIWKQVKTVARIVEGDAGKVICKEAERIKPAAVVLGTRGRSLFQRSAFPFLPFVILKLSLCVCHFQNPLFWFSYSVLQGSVGEYCFHHCKAAPVVIVPGKGDPSLHYSFFLTFSSDWILGIWRNFLFLWLTDAGDASIV